MIRRTIVPLASGALLLCLSGGAARAASLDYERRVDAHRAVERVLWEKRVWPESNPEPKPPLEKVLPERVLRDRVDDVLRKSSALEALWKRPIGSRELQAELDRMARGSRDPETWNAMLDALGRDPVLVAEAIARPALVDRLIRSWYASDPRYHETERKDAERAFSGVVSTGDLARVAPRYETITWTLDRVESVTRPSPHSIAVDDTEWRDLVLDLEARFPRDRSVLGANDGSVDEALASLPLGRASSLRETDSAYSTTVILSKTERALEIATATWPKTTFEAWWTGERSRHAPVVAARDGSSLPIVLPESAAAPVTCTDDTWTKTGTGAPSARYVHSMVWTGTEMIVWGGYNADGVLDTGARYDPATDTWSTVSSVGAPSARTGHLAVWTGSRMIVWGGGAEFPDPDPITGGRYDPVTDSWLPTSVTGAPTERLGNATWTGSRMVVWGSGFFSYPIGGSRYDPVADSWSPITTTNAPIQGLHDALGVWTGTELILWPAGKKYNPAADVWTPISTAGEPVHRSAHAAVWTGSRMIVWGGSTSTQHVNDGGVFDPATDTWIPMTNVGAPQGRISFAYAWVAGRMVVWSGFDDGFLETGGRYDPVTNTWSPTTIVGAPAARMYSTAIATATEMIVWGGIVMSGQYLDTGARYDPVSDSWVFTRRGLPSPEGRSQHAAVWTGAEMILWGGSDLSGFVDETASYAPATDTWTYPGSGAPSARAAHTAMWTGSSMLAWGGLDGSGYAGSGGSFNPASGVWTPMTNAGAPAGRSDHTAVWTGSRMVVWGGAGGSGNLLTGGRYDPATDQWLPTSLGGAPSARVMHSAVWSGTSMIVWGGTGGAGTHFTSGGRYDPGTDTWTSTTTTGAPTGRRSHAAVWTGSRMLVWGGYDGADLGTGSSYDPAADAWAPLGSTGAPEARRNPTAIWTGSEMIAWGGLAGSGALASGGRYRPDDDSWRSTTMFHAPYHRYSQTAIWAGHGMILWGGATATGGLYNDGATYCACVDWYPDVDGDGYGGIFDWVSTCDGSHPAGYVGRAGDCNDANAAIHPGVPDASCNGVDEDCDGPQDEDYLPQPSVCGLGPCRAFGSLECVSGQIVNTCVPGLPSAPIDDSCNTIDDDCDGGVDDDFPQRDDYWTAMTTAPAARTNHTAVWSGTEMIVFGGDNGSGSVQIGGNAYAVATNQWRTLAAGPLKRWHHTSVWTGSRMIVWGGDDGSTTIYSNGSRYDPATDTWAATTSTSAPTARGLHTAVWTGSRMVIWGGRDVVSYFNSGSRYDPVANTWSSTTTTGAPAGRASHTAVWTGTEMIVWGGQTTGGGAVSTGSRYNPTTNTWAATTTTGAPSARYGHVAQWTGTEMIVWGGTTDGVTYLSGGARYNPATNTWAPISTLGAPTRRAFASSVWTGEEMIVWGGTYRTNEEPDTPLANGARYNPAGDSWSVPMNVHLVLPAARARAAAVWTGTEMIVWGGDPNGAAMSVGGRYNPRTLCGTGGCARVGTTVCEAGGFITFACTPAPSSPEVCDGMDNDCDVAVDEGIPIPTAHPSIFGAKPSPGNASFSWAWTPDTTEYDVVRGTVGTLRSSAGNFTLAVDLCLVNNMRETTRDDAATPAVGDGFWYLVRPVNHCSGSGTYDDAIPPQQGSRDAEIAASPNACP